MSISRALLLALVGILLLTSCGDNCASQCRQRYNEGYRAGEQAGHTRGYREGYAEGERVGYRSGYLSGGQQFIGDSFIPSLTGAALLALIIVAVLAFKAVLNKTIGGSLKDAALWSHNLLSYLTLRRRVSSLEKLQRNRASIVARISALETLRRMETLLQDLEYNNEFTIILSKIELYLVGLHESSRQKFGDEIRRIAEATILADGLTLTERDKLLDAIRLVLISNISEVRNLTGYEKSAYSKISKDCRDFISHRRRYRATYRLRKVAVILSISANIVFLFGIYLSIFDPALLSSGLSSLYIIAHSFLP